MLYNSRCVICPRGDPDHRPSAGEAARHSPLGARGSSDTRSDSTVAAGMQPPHLNLASAAEPRRPRSADSDANGPICPAVIRASARASGGPAQQLPRYVVGLRGHIDTATRVDRQPATRCGARSCRPQHLQHAHARVRDGRRRSPRDGPWRRVVCAAPRCRAVGKQPIPDTCQRRHGGRI